MTGAGACVKYMYHTVFRREGCNVREDCLEALGYGMAGARACVKYHVVFRRMPCSDAKGGRFGRTDTKHWGTARPVLGRA